MSAGLRHALAKQNRGKYYIPSKYLIMSGNRSDFKHVIFICLCSKTCIVTFLNISLICTGTGRCEMKSDESGNVLSVNVKGIFLDRASLV